MNTYAAIPLTSCIAYVLLIGITLYCAWRSARYTFLLYLSVSMIWSLSSFVLHANFFPQHTLHWHIVRITAAFSTWIIYYHFVRSFTNRKSMRVVLLAGYGAIAIFALLAARGNIIESAYVADGLLYYKATPLLYLIGEPVAVAFFGLAVFTLVSRHRGTSDYAERNRIIYLLLGFAIMTWFHSASVSSFLSKYPIDHIGNLINALFITYVVVRYRLPDIGVLLRKALAYSLLILILAIAYFVLLFSLHNYFHTWTGYTIFGAVAGFVLLLAIMLRLLRSITERWVDRLFYRETYGYRQTLLTFSQRMNNVLDLKELAMKMLYPITKVFHVKQAILLLPEVEGGDFVTNLVQPAERESAATIRLRRDSPIVAWLGRGGRVLSRESIDTLPEFKNLWETEMKDFDALELEALWPIRRKDNLLGILALSRKQAGLPYSSEDVDLLTTITSEAAMVVENAMILNNLKEEQRRVEHLLAQTVQVQEEERKRIAVELHDSVAQWLVGIFYELEACRALLPKTDSNSAGHRGLAEIQAKLDRSVKEMRRLMAGLRPPILDELGLVHALRQALDELKPDGIAYDFKTTGEPIRLPASTEVAVYRVVQEALTNVRKHSEASAVTLHIQFEPEILSVEVSDNGKGFNLSKTMSNGISLGHMGLLGMNERVTTLGGTLRAKTRQGAGTTIRFTIPIAPLGIGDSLKTDGHNTQGPDNIGTGEARSVTMPATLIGDAVGIGNDSNA